MSDKRSLLKFVQSNIRAPFHSVTVTGPWQKFAKGVLQSTSQALQKP